MASKTVKKKTAPKSAKPRKETVDLSLDGLKEFIKFAGRFPVSKLSAGRNGARITVYQNPDTAARRGELFSAPVNEPAEAAALEQIKSDRVGVLHDVKDLRAGSKVKSGKTVAKIYAIGLDNEIKAPRDCVIREILVQENDLIEYGQPLFTIE